MFMFLCFYFFLIVLGKYYSVYPLQVVNKAKNCAQLFFKTKYALSIPNLTNLLKRKKSIKIGPRTNPRSAHRACARAGKNSPQI